VKHSALSWILLLLAASARAADPIATKSVPLDEFMHGQLNVAIKLPVTVPEEYEWAALSGVPASYSYWMRAEDVVGAASSGDLPAEHGYMYGKISLDVGYDRRKKQFVGVEDRSTMEQIRSAFPSVELNRFMYGEYPVLLLTMSDPSSGKAIYAMYVALNEGTNTVYVAFRPPQNSKQTGDYLWSVLKESLAKSNNSLERTRDR
jgi:hypothetical protein